MEMYTLLMNYQQLSKCVICFMCVLSGSISFYVRIVVFSKGSPWALEILL